jgi:hypothetical protein
MLFHAEGGTKKHERKDYPKDAKDAAKDFHQFSPFRVRSSKKPRLSRGYFRMFSLNHL